ncbi:hypothetical protein Q8A67_021327 [Cirrhinus molitorella]|uniref:Uncharacterized protein n=1 Tax=Cirrhinus molitorella TaxID=172907 RepID=A0AA88P9K7_9TELE|nr:hypothetical protein Q8A67_021327 [Cirrhinus molitorella]
MGSSRRDEQAGGVFIHAGACVCVKECVCVFARAVLSTCEILKTESDGWPSGFREGMALLEPTVSPQEAQPAGSTNQASIDKIMDWSSRACSYSCCGLNPHKQLTGETILLQLSHVPAKLAVKDLVLRCPGVSYSPMWNDNTAKQPSLAVRASVSISGYLSYHLRRHSADEVKPQTSMGLLGFMGNLHL